MHVFVNGWVRGCCKALCSTITVLEKFYHSAPRTVTALLPGFPQRGHCTMKAAGQVESTGVFMCWHYQNCTVTRLNRMAIWFDLILYFLKIINKKSQIQQWADLAQKRTSAVLMTLFRIMQKWRANICSMLCSKVTAFWGQSVMKMKLCWHQKTNKKTEGTNRHCSASRERDCDCVLLRSKVSH